MKRQEFEKLCIESFSKIYSEAKAKNEIQFLTSCFAFYKQFDQNIMSYVTDYEFNEVLDLLNNFKQFHENDELVEPNKTRIRMFLYCHIIEVDLVYMILFNMLRTIKGEKYSSIISFKSKKGDIIEVEYPVKKIEQIVKESQTVGITLKPIYSEFYHSHLRNAFSHSKYFFDDKGGFNLSKKLSPTSSEVHKKASKKNYYQAKEIKTVFNKSILYLKTFIDNHKSFLKGYMDGGHYATQFGKINYDKKQRWIFANN